jgi:alpha-amylase
MKMKVQPLLNDLLKTLLVTFFLSLFSTARIEAQNDAMMQAFYWNVPVNEGSHNGSWWDTLNSKATELKNAGITGLWVPCPSKGNWGITDMGYGIYDHYDLGNYSQKGSTETRFGSRQELADMLTTMHQSPRINTYADIILNHVYSDDSNEESNPAVKAYVFGEAHSGANTAYPTNEIKWVIPGAAAGDYYIQIKGYNLNWGAATGERGYDVNINWTGASTTDNGVWEYEPNNGSGQYNTFPGSGHTVRGHAGSGSDIDEYKITLSSAHDIVIRLTAKREQASPFAWLWADQTNGYYPVAIWYSSSNLASTTLQARTNTAISYVTHTGTGEPNYSWNYSHFHPSDASDWLGGPGSDEIITNTKFFGNDFNTFNDTVKARLKSWGYWLAKQVGFDGFRLDFVRGFQESFVADWVNYLPALSGKQRFIVGEYWGSGYRIKNWVNTVRSGGAVVTGFDFPLKSSLTDMCNGNGSSFNMAWLNHAGMVRDNSGNSLPDSSVVTFLDNHDTGKEHDKWVTKDYKLGYAYMLTHQARPCIFYPHYFGVTQQDAGDPSTTVTAPSSLKSDINKLIQIRKTYLGGSLSVLSESGNPYPSGDTYNVYVARRQGNGTKNGAVIVINNHDSNTKGLWVDVTPSGYENWAGLTLYNAITGTDSVYVYPDGRAYFSAPPRGYTIWVKKTEYQALTASRPGLVMAAPPATETMTESFTAYPNPADRFVKINVSLKENNPGRLTVINSAGVRVSELYNGTLSKGQNSFSWNCAAFPAGIYFCILHTGKETYQRQISLVK